MKELTIKGLKLMRNVDGEFQLWFVPEKGIASVLHLRTEGVLQWAKEQKEIPCETD